MSITDDLELVAANVAWLQINPHWDAEGNRRGWLAQTKQTAQSVPSRLVAATIEELATLLSNGVKNQRGAVTKAPAKKLKIKLR